MQTNSIGIPPYCTNPHGFDPEPLEKMDARTPEPEGLPMARSTPTKRRNLELRHLTTPRIPRSSANVALESSRAAREQIEVTTTNPFNGSKGPGFIEWLKKGRPKKTPQSQVAKQYSNIPKFYRPFERVCACDPALLLILNQLSTPDIIALMWTSRTVSHFICSQTGAEVFKEIVMVRDERWPMLAGVRKRIDNRDRSWKFDGQAVKPWRPASPFFKEVIEWVAHYKDMDEVEKRVQWATDFKLQAERLDRSGLIRRDRMEKIMIIAQHDRLSEFMDIAKWKLSDAEAYLDIEFPQHVHTVKRQTSNPFASPFAAFDHSSIDNAAIPSAEMAFYTKFNDFSFNSYFSRLRFPQNITRIVLDGTAITNQGLYKILRTVERSLESISTRACRNISARVYTEWLEDIALAGEVIPLEEISTFGASGLEGRYMSSHTLMNPLDYYRNGFKPPTFTKFGACMPVHAHAKFSLPLLIPQHFSLEEKLFIYEWMLYQLRKDEIEWNEYCKQKQLDRNIHYFSGGLILHEIPEQTRLMAVCGFLNISIDLNFCAGGKNCYSYNDSEVPKMFNEGCAGPCIDFPLGFRIPRNYYELLKKWNDPHPFNLTQRYRRREEGGMPCRSCGHYEYKRVRDYPGNLLPVGRWLEFIHLFQNWEARLALSKFGGINYNQDEVGWNRLCGTGEYCDHCVRNLTCSQCDAFFCMNCVIIQTHGLPFPWRLPLLPDTLLYGGICEIHTPICGNCIHINDIVVQCKMTKCRKMVCTLCHPNGVSLMPSHRAMDPALPDHPKYTEMYNPHTSVIRDVVGGITEMPERKSLREHLAKMGCEETVLYDRCDICRDTVCTDCQRTTAETFCPCFGSCGRKICNVCVARVCDTCDRSLCEDCAVHDDEQRQQIIDLLFPVSRMIDPNDENDFQNCSRCIMKGKIANLKAEGKHMPNKEQYPQLFPDDSYDEDNAMDTGESEDGDRPSSGSEDEYGSDGELQKELPSIAEILENDPDLTYNAKLSSFIGGHAPEESKVLNRYPLEEITKQKKPNKNVLVKTALDKLCEQEKIRICRAIFVCATLRPLMPYLQDQIQYLYELSDPELPFYKQKPEGIKLIPQHFNYSTYPKIVDDLQNKDFDVFVWNEYFKRSLQIQIEAWKKYQKDCNEQGLVLPVPEFLDHTVSAHHLLKFIYCNYNRYIVPEMRQEQFGKLDNLRAQDLVRHHYMYNESFLHALKTEMTNEYIDWNFIIGPDLMHKYLDPEEGLWKVNKLLNVNYARHLFNVLAWHEACKERVENYLAGWRYRRAVTRIRAPATEIADPKSDEEAECEEKRRFEAMDKINYPKPVIQPDDTEITYLGSVYEMLPLPGTGFSPNIIFNDYT